MVQYSRIELRLPISTKLFRSECNCVRDGCRPSRNFRRRWWSRCLRCCRDEWCSIRESSCGFQSRQSFSDLNAMVSEMVADHHEIFVADGGRAAFDAAAMNGAVFANRVAASNLDKAFQI